MIRGDGIADGIAGAATVEGFEPCGIEAIASCALQTTKAQPVANEFVFAVEDPHQHFLMVAGQEDALVGGGKRSKSFDHCEAVGAAVHEVPEEDQAVILGQRKLAEQVGELEYCEREQIPPGLASPQGHLNAARAMIRHNLIQSMCADIALPADCEVFDQTLARETALPPCSAAKTADCYRLVEDAACTTSHHLRVDVLRSTTPSTDTMVAVRCRL